MRMNPFPRRMALQSWRNIAHRPTMSPRKQLLLLLVATAALGVWPLAGCGRQENPSASSSPSKSVQADLLVVERLEAPSLFEATGNVRAQFNAVLSSKVLARVVSVRVREGDSVGEGQSLVSLDSRELSSAVQMASANLKAASVGVGNARTTAEMEASTSTARIAQAEAQVAQSKAALEAARSRLDLALAGPRTQEKTQAHLAVVQAESSLRLAKIERDRVARLVEAGAVAQRNLDQAQTAYEVAKAQYDTAIQAEKIAQEGTREQDIRGAKEAVSQAEAALRQAEAGVKQARAAALQVNVRKEEVAAAKAQVAQSKASLQAAQVGLGYATVTAPFSGRVVQRFADPGAMATPGAPLLGVEGGEFRLEAIVPESVLAHVSMGQLVEVRLDALADKPMQAVVAEIVPQGDASTHSFLVKLTLPADDAVRSGMFGRARIRTGTKRALLIPSTATWEREGLNYVYAVNAEGIARLRIVSLGNPDGDRIEVLAGLAPGDRIVVGSRDGVTDGAKVEAKRR